MSLSQDRPDVVIVYGEYDDGSEYAEIPTRNKVRIYTGKQQETIHSHFMYELGADRVHYLPLCTVKCITEILQPKCSFSRRF